MEVSARTRRTLTRAPQSGPDRLGRVALLAGVPLLLASGAHLVGGGSLPGVGVLLGAVALLLVATLVSTGRCRFGLLLPLLAAEQVLLHLLLEAAEASAMCLPSASGAAQHAGHLAHGTAAGLAPVTAGGLEACAASHAMGSGWGMVAAHAGATLLVAWVLARGEAWWWRTVAELVRVTSVRPTRRRPRAVAVLAGPVAHATRLLLHAASPRGPPLCS